MFNRKTYQARIDDDGKFRNHASYNHLSERNNNRIKT